MESRLHEAKNAVSHDKRARACRIPPPNLWQDTTSKSKDRLVNEAIVEEFHTSERIAFFRQAIYRSWLGLKTG
jgi:hypothetical protein